MAEVTVRVLKFATDRVKPNSGTALSLSAFSLSWSAHRVPMRD